ncbi:hypothetical protein L6452_12642 [Arctium lappa]|uniref:Uncharacterized protein n=1 Tax=Arctium lappa TaxID=4217 RepID=A0ACB9DQU2_ARCLA|nr:hypothetical protein L6452_12642 [Arctium lappa]
MEDDNERGRRSNRLLIKRSSKISNNDDTTIVNDCVVEGERTPEETAVVAKNKKKRSAKSGPPCSENTSLNQQEVHEQNKRQKTIPESNVMARQPAGKPKMVTTSSGVRVILPSFTPNTTRKIPKKDKSNKSTDTRKSSKSPVKKKSSKSTVSVTGTETIKGAIVVESTRKTRSKTRETTVQRVSKKTKHGKGMDTGPTECSYTPSTTKAKTVKKKMEYIKLIESKMNSIMCQKISAEQTIEKAIEDYPTDPYLRSLNQALQRLFNTEDGDTGGSDQEQNNEHVFKTPTRTKDSKQDQPTLITDNDPTPNESVGLELVPGVPLETDAYWNSPTTIMAIDNSCIDYCKKRRIDRDEIPKFDLGISPERKPVSPLPISSIIPITKGVFSLNSRVKAICDAPRLGKRAAKPGEALRSPYVKRTVDINTSETSSELKICAWINVAVEPVCEPVFETTTGTVALRGTVESLCARTEIYNNTDTMLKPDTSPDLKVKMFVDNILASVGDDAQVITFKGVDLVFFPIIRDMHFFVVVFNFKRPSILIIDNIQQELETPAKFEEIPDLLVINQKHNLCFS